MPLLIPLNADLGEGGGHDAELMPYLATANVGCGAHAGDLGHVRAALELARTYRVEVGAHPGYPDRASFGRVELGLGAAAIRDLVLMQVGGLVAMAKSLSVTVSYLKPHGALYHRCHRDEAVATAVAEVAGCLGLGLMGLPDSPFASVARRHRLAYHREGFLDRRYRPDGSLVPRGEPDAFVTDPDEAVAQAVALLPRVDTLCVHGDDPGAVAFVRAFCAAMLRRTPPAAVDTPDRGAV